MEMLMHSRKKCRKFFETYLDIGKRHIASGVRIGNHLSPLIPWKSKGHRLEA
jgi:hypothetical protein